jgi:ADP-heptose:LPS heptosyltransferase
VGLHRFTSEAPYRGDLMTHRVHYNPYLHTAKAYALLVEALDADPGDIPLVKTKTETVIAEAPVFVPTAAERASMERRLAEEFHCPAGALRILLNPNASDMLPLRKWDAERFVELGQRLLQEHPEVHLLITGAPSEAPSAAEVCRQIGSERAFCVAGRTTLRELIVLYSLADVLVTNDSGPGHFASMTNIESVVMYGPETPALFGAIGGQPHTVYAGLACSPCVNVFNHRFSPCTNNRCMQVISVAEIYAIVTSCMRRTRQE